MKKFICALVLAAGILTLSTTIAQSDSGGDFIVVPTFSDSGGD